MENSSSQKVNWLSVAVYYLIACAVSWPFFWWRDMEKASWQMWNVPGFIKTWSYMWGPGIAAIICLYIFRKTHRRTISLFGSSTLKSSIFYVFPILLLIIPGIEGQGMNPHLAPLFLGGIGFISILGEELGWRGFLQDALRPLPLWKRYIFIGVLWEFWHFTNRMGHGALPQIIIRVSIFIAAIIIISYVIGEATDRSKSLMVAVTIHAWINILAEYNSLSTWIIFGISVPFWTYLLWKWKERELIVEDAGI